MPPAPLTTSILTGLVGTIGLVHLALAPDPFSEQRSLLVAVGMAVLTLVVTTGLLLARGRWSRWALLALGAAWMGLALRDDLEPVSIALLGGSAALVSMAIGPWLPRWLRHRPSAEGPPEAAVVLLLGLIAMPVLIGVTAVGPGTAEWVVSVWSLLLAVGIARAVPTALWLGRLLHLPLAALVAVTIGMPEGLVVGVLGAAQAALMWRRDVHLAVSPLVPEPAQAVPIPRELADPAILRSVGLDEDGNPLEDR
jgi:hypothetical protein